MKLSGLPKPVLFALVGALGCLLGAIPGELFLLATYQAPPPQPPPPPPQSICLLIDCSGSMNGAPLREVKAAARRFVARIDLSRNQVAVVGFGSRVHPMVGLQASKVGLEASIDALSDGGSTRMDLALAEARRQLENRRGEPCILLFTDGMPDDKRATLQEAEASKVAGIKIVTIAAGDADTRFLAGVTGDPSRVIPTSTGSFGGAFEKAEKSLFGHQLLQSGVTGAYSFLDALVRVGGWTGLISWSLVVSLVASQAYLLRRRLPKWTWLLAASVAGLGAGIIAGLTAQVLFSVLAIVAFLEAVARIAGWGILGALIGRSMAFVVPNMRAKPAFVGGAVGGGIGGIAFLYLSNWIGDLGGRFLGAVVIGATVGLLVGLVEVLFREAWLTVAFGIQEHRTVSLGVEPVTLGSGANSTIFVNGGQPLVATFTLVSGKLTYIDEAGIQRPVAPGAWMKIGTVVVAVNTSGARADASELMNFFGSSPPLTTGIASQLADREAQQPARSPTATVLELRLKSGASLRLVKGTSLFGSDLGDLTRSAVAIAQVQAHPTDSEAIGLVNLSTTTWTVRDETRKTLTITPRMTLGLRVGLTVDLGFTSVEVVAAPAR